MLVSQLIEILKTMPQYATVVTNCDGEIADVSNIKKYLIKRSRNFIHFADEVKDGKEETAVEIE